MAPRKEKSDKTNADQGAAMILEYLRKQNRPYSATDVSSNLHNKVTKTAAAKYLKVLSERREVEERLAGKQAVYHFPQQHQSPEDTENADVADLDAQTNALRDAVSSLKATEKALKIELGQLSSLRSLDELQATVTAMEIQKAGLQERIIELKKVDVQPCSEEERVEVDAQLVKWKKVYNERRRIMRNLWDLFQESGICPEGTPLEDFWMELGCEGPMPR